MTTNAMDLANRTPLEASYRHRTHAARVESELQSLHAAVAAARLALAEVGGPEQPAEPEWRRAAWMTPALAALVAGAVHALVGNSYLAPVAIACCVAAWVALLDRSLHHRTRSMLLAREDAERPAMWPWVFASGAVGGAGAVAMWLLSSSVIASCVTGLSLLATSGAVLGTRGQALLQEADRQRVALRRRVATDKLTACEANLEAYRQGLLPERLAIMESNSWSLRAVAGSAEMHLTPVADEGEVN